MLTLSTYPSSDPTVTTLVLVPFPSTAPHYRTAEGRPQRCYRCATWTTAGSLVRHYLLLVCRYVLIGRRCISPHYAMPHTPATSSGCGYFIILPTCGCHHTTHALAAVSVPFYTHTQDPPPARFTYLTGHHVY